MSGEARLEQALQDARDNGDLLENLVFCRLTVDALDFSDLTFRRTEFRQHL